MGGGFYYSRVAEELQKMQKCFEDEQKAWRKLEEECQLLRLECQQMQEQQRRSDEAQRRMEEKLAQMEARFAGPLASQVPYWQIPSQAPPGYVPMTYSQLPPIMTAEEYQRFMHWRASSGSSGQGGNN